MPDVAPLIATKFHQPPPAPDLVPRPRLFKLLEDGLSQPLTLISAPPGFGKTMLVASWLHMRLGQDGFRTCWISLEESDNDTSLFWRYFITAIQQVSPAWGETAKAMLASTSPPAMQTILATLINDLAVSETPLLFVLDDYHLIQSSEIHKDLSFFIDHLPASIHLLILTREDPPLGLARRRARRQMVEVRAADLRFGTQETTTFLNDTKRLGLTPEQIALLERRTEGWIVGLQMAALSLQGGEVGSFFESFSGDDRYIADYLIEEVLQRQPEPLREFLLKTSILDRLCASLCTSLMGDLPAPFTNSQEVLEHLERANLFLIPLDSHREWYRYHQLFAGLLRQRLHDAVNPAEMADLHRAAGAWFVSQGDIPHAIRHAQRIPDDELVLQLLERHAGWFYAHVELPQLCELAAAVPPALRETSPALCMAVAWAALASNQPRMAGEWLDTIVRHFGIPEESALEDASLDTSRRAALLEVLVVRLQLPTGLPHAAMRDRIVNLHDQLDRLAPDQFCLFNSVNSLKPVIAFDLGQNAEQSGETVLAAQALNEAIALARQMGNNHLFYLAQGHLANVQTMQGHLHAARQTHEQALVEAEGLGHEISPFVSLAHAGLGALFYEWDDLPAAARHFEAGLSLARLWNQWESLVPIALGQARLKQRQGDTPAALAILDIPGSPPRADMTLPLQAYAALLRARLGDHATAGAWLASSELLSTLEPAPVNEAILLEIARLLALLNRTDESLKLAQDLILRASQGEREHTRLQAEVIQAKTMVLQGNLSGAIETLTHALRRAAPEGYISTFVDEGESIHRLLTAIRSKTLPGDGLRTYIDQVLAGFVSSEHSPARPVPGARLPETLSEREREVLLLMAEGLSNQEIAGRLVISITTVKTHVGNIFNKLGANSRTQAIARAEGLGLLPRP
jgi:LuxR family maltose regulon positive regulatory protein